jgi:hypothetical protein
MQADKQGSFKNLLFFRISTNLCLHLILLQVYNHRTLLISSDFSGFNTWRGYPHGGFTKIWQTPNSSNNSPAVAATIALKTDGFWGTLW